MRAFEESTWRTMLPRPARGSHDHWRRLMEGWRKPMTWHTLAAFTDIPDSGALEAGVEGLPLALFKVEGKVYCTGNLCTHAEAFLSDGYLEGYEIECPLHGARFDIRDGRVLCQPARKDIASYLVRLDGTDVLVELP